MFVTRYFFAFAVEEGKRLAAFFTINKHWAGRIPRVGCHYLFYCRVQNGVVNKAEQAALASQCRGANL